MPSAVSLLVSSGLRECRVASSYASPGYLHMVSCLFSADPSEAAIIIGYPAPHDRGFYLAVWQTAKALGPIVGGAINLGLNVGRSEAGSVG